MVLLGFDINLTKDIKMSKMDRWKKRVKHLKTETYAIYLASKDPRVPWYAKALIFLIIAHTFSPIDLIPDFIPVLGYLDDLIIAPVGIAIALRLIPKAVLTECRAQAQLMMATREMQEMNMSFNLQYLMMQQKMQGENRQFTLMSNIMKTKHDTAKNAISNVR